MLNPSDSSLRALENPSEFIARHIGISPADETHMLGVVGWQSAPEGLFMARERHVRALEKVDDHLVKAALQFHATSPALDLLAEDLRQAQLHLSEITGQFTSDDLLGEIFSKFCIGK